MTKLPFLYASPDIKLGMIGPSDGVPYPQITSLYLAGIADM